VKLSEQLLQDNADVWRTWLPHPFTQSVADGSLPREVFLRWLAQDFRFVSEGLRFLAVLLGKAPAELVDPLAGTIHAWNSELTLFRAEAQRAGADLAARPLFVTQAYADFLLAVAHREAFAIGWAVLFGVERSYHDAWRWAREHAVSDNPYRAWIDNWGSDGFGAFVEGLASRLDALAPGLDDATRSRLDERFAETARFEVHFWEMAWRGELFAVPK